MTDHHNERVFNDGVVAGVDGSEGSLRAAQWAAAEAQRRGQPLTVVTAYSVSGYAASSLDGGYAHLDDSALQQGAQEILDQTRASLGENSATIDYRIDPGDPADVLVRYSESAELLVVGSRGRGGFFSRLLGSISSTVTAHAKCPVAVIPLKYADDAQQDAPLPVVVGVDGSNFGRVAALIAAQEAAERQTTLRLICAMPPLGSTLVWIPTHVDDAGAVSVLEQKIYAGSLWLSYHFPELRVEAEVIEGTAVDVLVAQTGKAQLTVVGSKGRGGFTGMLIGSTSQGVIQHAEGPLMVVPHAYDDRIADRQDFGPVL